jgi:predicted Holliday junction resolvase-like endonuclease
MRRPDTIAQLQAAARIYGRCPTCDEDFPLGRAILFHADAPLPGAARERLEARRRDLQARASALRERRRRARVGAMQKAIDVNVGKILERVAPVCDGFGSVPRDCRPLFDPIDYVVFNGLSLHGEVKSADPGGRRGREGRVEGVFHRGPTMTSPLVATFQDFRRILGVCPCCGEVFRLADLKIAYRARPTVTWLDRLEAEEDRQERAEDRFAEDEQRIRELARERGRRALPRLLREAEPVFACRGYFAHDVKPLFDPVDYIVFDGMNGSPGVKRVVLFDGPGARHVRERAQRSIQRALEAGNYEWKTVRMAKDGRIQPERGGSWVKESNRDKRSGMYASGGKCP